MIESIEIHRHQVILGKTQEEHNSWENAITPLLNSELISLDMRKVDLFNLRGGKQSYKAGSNTRLTIYGNATRHSGEPTPVDIINGDIASTEVAYDPDGNGIVITSDNGVPLAEYHSDYNELSILFDLFNEYTEERVELFKQLMQKFEALVWLPKTFANSWLHTSDKDALTKRFLERFKEQRLQQLQEDKRKADNYGSRIKDFKRDIKTSYDNMIRLRNNIESEEANLENVDTQFVKDLDLIVKHQKVSDLIIKDGLFYISVPSVYAHASNGKRYYIGNMKMTIKLEEADVRFYGDNKRHGYWSEKDPHPHVSGSGSPCLGNLSGTIAELSARNEIYALVMVCIDFLENANVEDTAGRNVIMWDEVDENGVIIRPGGNEERVEEQGEEEEERDTFHCEHCEEYYDQEDTDAYTAYDGINDDEDLTNEVIICEGCRNEDYTYSEHHGEYVNDNVDLSEVE